MKTRLNLAAGRADWDGVHTNERANQTCAARLDAGRLPVAVGQHPDGHRRLRDGRALTRLLAVVSLAAVLAAGLLFAQSPPLPSLPPTPALRPVKVLWDPQPASEYYAAVDTNGNFVGITYRVYNATNVIGPWTVVATTTNLSATISNLTARTQFFYVTASNFFLESEASRIVSIPQDKVPLPRLLIGE
jgi:hypothetical protein